MENKAKALLTRLKSSHLVMNYVWVFVGQNLGTLFSMLSLIVTLRIISTEDYGALVVIQTYTLLISNLFCARTFNGVIKYVTDLEAQEKVDEIKSYVKTAFMLDVLAGIIAFCMGLLLLKPVTIVMGWDPQTVTWVNLYLPLVLFLPALNGAAVGILRKLDKFKQVNLIHAVVLGVQLLILSILWILAIHNFQLVLIIYTVTEIIECVAITVLALAVSKNNEKYSKFWKAKISKDMAFIKFNLFYGLTGAIDQLLGNISTLLINKYVGNLGTAYLKVITKMCSLLTKLSNPFSQIIYPELCNWISEKKERKALAFAYKYFCIVCGIGCVLGLGMFGTYDWWIKIFDPNMVSAKWQSMLYMVYTVLSMSIICINQCIFALNLTKLNMYITIILNCTYIVALIPVIRIWGIYGYLILQILQLLLSVTAKTVIMRYKVNQMESRE